MKLKLREMVDVRLDWHEDAAEQCVSTTQPSFKSTLLP